MKNLVLLTTALISVFINAFAQTYQPGDVFVSVSSGQIQWRSSTGTLIQTLNTGYTASLTLGIAFDVNHNLYVANYQENAISTFNNQGVLQGLFGSGHGSPESIVFDAAGNVYVGNTGNITPSPGIKKYNAAGTFLGISFSGRVDWMDLQPDQCTMLFGQEGTVVKRHNVCTNTALSDFATGLGGEVFALRIRTNGEVLVANGVNILHLSSTGTILQTYDVAGNDKWFGMTLNTDGTSFWSADFGTSNVYKFDIATGNILTSFSTGTPINTAFGLATFGELTVSCNSAFYQDADNDGFGNPNMLVYACSQPPSYVADNTDCDDTNANVNTCNNAIPTLSEWGLIIFALLLLCTGAVAVWRGRYGRAKVKA